MPALPPSRPREPRPSKLKNFDRESDVTIALRDELKEYRKAVDTIWTNSLPLSFTVNRRFHAGYSFLGRLIRRRIKDEHYAEGIYILALSMTGVGLTLLFFLGWALVQSFALSHAYSPEELIRLYAIGQIAAALLFFLTCLVGFKPALRVTLSSDRLSIRQGELRYSVPLDRIKDFSSISALHFHRHYRKFKKTRSFFVRLPSILLLLTTDSEPIVLGLSSDDQKILTDYLSMRSVQTGEPAPVAVS